MLPTVRAKWVTASRYKEPLAFNCPIYLHQMEMVLPLRAKWVTQFGLVACSMLSADRGRAQDLRERERKESNHLGGPT